MMFEIVVSDKHPRFSRAQELESRLVGDDPLKEMSYSYNERFSARLSAHKCPHPPNGKSCCSRMNSTSGNDSRLSRAEPGLGCGPRMKDPR
jgi:hypothetical protein